MRVISGTRKGHRLKAPKGMDVRPTEDKIKESIFNILGNIDQEELVLDLFAGSGSIGIEFLSRGAKECYFVDLSSKSISIIKDNLLHTKLRESARVMKSDSIRAIKTLSKKKIKFDYIFLDPPFKHNELLLKVINTLNDYQILTSDGLIIVEHESELKLEDKLFNFKKIDKRRYGSKTISFFNTIP